jgi:hypothetical protein
MYQIQKEQAVPSDQLGRLDKFALDQWDTEGGRVPDECDPPRSGTTLAHLVPPTGQSQPTVNGRGSSLNRKARVVEKPVYTTLAVHQSEEADWDYHDLAVFFGEWYSRFNDRFRLCLPQVPLRLDPRIRRNCGGYFLPGHNEFGLVYEIAVAVPPPEQLAGVDRGDLLGTLLHEQLHLLQELNGIRGKEGSNYHNAQYRATAERFGLLVDYRGCQQYATDSVFLDLLAEFGVEPPYSVLVERATLRGENPPPAPPPKKNPGRSKLRKWSCGCTNVRVGVSEFFAKCTREKECGKPYRPC